MWAGVPATPPSFVTPREEATADEPIRRETVPGPAPGSAEFHVGNSFMIDVTQGRRANQLRVNDVTAPACHFSSENRMRGKINFASRFNAIWSFRPGSRNISLYPKINLCLYRAVSCSPEGRTRRHERRAEMRWTVQLQQTSVVAADGEGVWS